MKILSILTSLYLTFVLSGCTAPLSGVADTTMLKNKDIELQNKKASTFLWNDEKRNIIFQIEGSSITPISAQSNKVKYKKGTYCLTTKYEFCNKAYRRMTNEAFSKREHQSVIGGAVTAAILAPFGVVEDGLGLLTGDTNFSGTKTAFAGSKKIDKTVLKKILDKTVNNIMLEYSQVRHNSSQLVKFVDKYQVKTLDRTLKRDLSLAYNQTANSSEKQILDKHMNWVEEDAFKASSNSIKKLDHFITTYPNSKFVAKARQQKSTLLAKKQRRQQARRDAEAAESRAYSRKKSVGDSICRTGKVRGLIFSNDYRMRGFVERVNGNKIQIRITDVLGIGSYNGTNVRGYKPIIWDYYSNWKHYCK